MGYFDSIPFIVTKNAMEAVTVWLSMDAANKLFGASPDPRFVDLGRLSENHILRPRESWGSDDGENSWGAVWVGGNVFMCTAPVSYSKANPRRIFLDRLMTEGRQ